MASKITPEMLELLLPQKAPPALLIPRWGVVTSTNPLRVQLAGDDDPLPIAPKSLAVGLAVGRVVWCVLQGTDLLIIDQLGGPTGAKLIKTANHYGEPRMADAMAAMKNALRLTDDEYMRIVTGILHDTTTTAPQS